jgi:RNA polymerase sigma-70 factor (ECF subfamily)
VRIDKILIQRCLEGERKAQFELYRECYAPMMQVCLRYQNNDQDAMHILNQAFLSICTKLDQYREEVVFESWVKRITINACIDEYRRNKTRNGSTDSLDDEGPSKHFDSSVQNLAELELDAAALRTMIRRLPATTQQVFNLAILDGYPYDEVSEILDITETTCRWHVHHARKKLQEMLLRDEQEVKNIAS